jgi:hypothetical protein
MSRIVIGTENHSVLENEYASRLTDAIGARPSGDAATPEAAANAIRDTITRIHDLKGADTIEQMQMFARSMGTAMYNLQLKGSQDKSRDTLADMSSLARGVATVIAWIKLHKPDAAKDKNGPEEQAAWEKAIAETVDTGVTYNPPSGGNSVRDVARISAEAIRELVNAHLSTETEQAMWKTSMDQAVTGLIKSDAETNASDWVKQHPEAKRDALKDMAAFAAGLASTLDNLTFNPDSKENPTLAYVGVTTDRRDYPNAGAPLK